MVHEFVAADKIPHFWRGNGLFFRKSELDVWVARAERLHLRRETITLERAAAYLDLPQAMFVQLADESNVGAVRDGNRWRFALSALDAWREEQEKQLSQFARRKMLAREQATTRLAAPASTRAATSPSTYEKRTAPAAPSPTLASPGPMTRLERKQAAMRERQAAARIAAREARLAPVATQCKCPPCGTMHEPPTAHCT